MKSIKILGLILLLGAFGLFNVLFFLGEFKVSDKGLSQFIESKRIKSEVFIKDAQTLINQSFDSPKDLSAKILSFAERSHQYHRAKINDLEAKGVDQSIINTEWGKVIWLKAIKKHGDFSYPLVKASGYGFIVDHKVLLFFLTFGIGIIGGLMFVLTSFALDGPAGIKNNGIFQNQATNKGWIAWSVFGYLIWFYLLLYFFPDYLVNMIYIVDPISEILNGGSASQWFLYGFMYCVFMIVMGIRMFIKYRHNKYQIVRTISVLFFQIGFAFLIPELLVKFNLPWYDFKNSWPLNYTFFFDWNINQLLNSGNIGLFMLVWGVFLAAVIVPVMVYFYGKRWYCSWVCGCGGLAETLGDPYRQHSDKSMKAWKLERYLIHGVLVFAVLMTGATLYSYFSESKEFFGIETENIRFWYGFAIGSIFSGVIGTGFYPIFGNRVWCRFGCPLAAYMGIVQRFKSRFRITTNGGQCISCGNCSTYCEQGIDVRAYAQKGQNIVRSSCVGCGICAAVCPRGVLKLENGPEEKRILEDNPILIGNDGVKLRED
ncbi:MAG: FeS-binding protein [Flavobacteriales bacterium]|nr:FeS-binding protein [Flavobacteriales bacterium]|tara:strand:- start:18363 stop:19991 length:1629 start_codon:yes stop_codon:yes gene_type:complete